MAIFNSYFDITRGYIWLNSRDSPTWSQVMTCHDLGRPSDFPFPKDVPDFSGFPQKSFRMFQKHLYIIHIQIDIVHDFLKFPSDHHISYGISRFFHVFPVAERSPPPDRTWLGEVAGGLHPRWPSDNDLALNQPG